LLPVVAIVGRPNVGKSTLFNRIVGRRTAVVDPTPGVTRDRLYAECEWNGRRFLLVDTGGISAGDKTTLATSVRRQAEEAMAEAAVLIFVVDARSGILPDDEELAGRLRRVRKPVVLAANKTEGAGGPALATEFFALGLGEPVPVAAEHGQGIGDLLDVVVEKLPPLRDVPEPSPSKDDIRVAVVGRPNVGKSSLVNALLGYERVIVSEIPGTTRDAVDVVLERDGQRFVLVDTAGVRRKSRIKDPVEHYGVLRGLGAVERADVALLVIDAKEGVTEQDQRLAGHAHEVGCGLVVVVNKWDLVPKTPTTAKEYEEQVRARLAFAPYAEVITVSALTGLRVGKLLDLVKKVADSRRTRVPAHELHDIVARAVVLSPPPDNRGHPLRIHYVRQAPGVPPTFVFLVNDPDAVHFAYARYLENQLREAFGFEGSPVRLLFRRRRKGTAAEK